LNSATFVLVGEIYEIIYGSVDELYGYVTGLLHAECLEGRSV